MSPVWITQNLIEFVINGEYKIVTFSPKVTRRRSSVANLVTFHMWSAIPNVDIAENFAFESWEKIYFI